VIGDKEPESPLGVVVKLERDGVTFFRRANEIAADPRVRQLFERLARDREEGARLIEDAIAKAGVKVPPATGASLYPFEAVAKVECYACGYVATEIPTSCPQCGAARYSFEKEFTAAMVWEIVMSSGTALAHAAQASLAGARGGLKVALESLLKREQALTKEAEGELASAKA